MKLIGAMAKRITSFQEAMQRSKFIFQYECPECDEMWWGNLLNKSCKDCKDDIGLSIKGRKLDLNEMVGIGWFKCDCGRTFSSFVAEGVKCKCHACGKASTPACVVSGDDPSNATKSGAKSSHWCSLCNGNGFCSAVAAARSNRRM